MEGFVWAWVVMLAIIATAIFVVAKLPTSWLPSTGGIVGQGLDDEAEFEDKVLYPMMERRKLESDIETEVCLRAEQNGWFVRKLQWIGRVGAPDRIFIRDGRVVFIEFKRPGGVSSPGQERESFRLTAAGVESYVVSDTASGHAILA